jgi:hypothetical protein
VLYSGTISTTMPSLPFKATVNVVGNIYIFSLNGIQYNYTDIGGANALSYGSVGILVNNATNVIVDNLIVNFDRK